MKLNKKAACSNVATAKDLKHFKQVSEVGVRTPRYAALGNTKRDAVPSDVVQGFTYGRKVRPSTPMYEVINNRAGSNAEQQLTQHYDVLKREKDEATNMVYKIYSTKASRGHAMPAKVQATSGSRNQYTEAEPAFQLKRFQNVKSKVDSTERSDDLFAGSAEAPK